MSARRGSSWPSQMETRHGAESRVESSLWALVSDAADMNVGEGLSGVLEGSFFQERQSKEKRLPGCLSPCPNAQLGLSPAASLIPYPASCMHPIGAHAAAAPVRERSPQRGHARRGTIGSSDYV